MEMNNGYLVKNIVKYILYKEGNMTNLRLQKILYFMQAYFLIYNNHPLFQEEIEAWSYGPVVREIYDEYRYYGSGIIPKIEAETNDINPEHKKIIDSLLSNLSSFSTFQLVDMTHSYDIWSNPVIYCRGDYEEYCNRTIKKNEIKEYHDNRRRAGIPTF